MSTENEKQEKNEEKINWKKTTIEAIIYGVVTGLVIVFLSRMGWI